MGVLLRHGIGDGRSRTLFQVVRELGFSHERARQLETVALPELRNPVFASRRTA